MSSDENLKFLRHALKNLILAAMRAADAIEDEVAAGENNHPIIKSHARTATHLRRRIQEAKLALRLKRR